jgi:hypothetical protein
MAPRGTKQEDQAAVILDPEDTAVVLEMMDKLGLKRAEVVRRLVSQGIVALRAAASAVADGGNPDLAGVRAVLEAQADEEVMKRLWDLANDHLEQIERRNWRDATLLAWQAGVGWQRWADRLAASHGTTVDELRNAQEA